jgi:hypothetical protein
MQLPGMEFMVCTGFIALTCQAVCFAKETTLYISLSQEANPLLEELCMITFV